MAMDYIGPDIEPEEVREAMRLKHNALFRFFLREKNQFSSEERDPDRRSIGTLEDKNTNSLQTTSVMPHVAFAGDTTTVVLTEGNLSPLEVGANGRVDSPQRINAVSMIDIPQADINSKIISDLQVQPTVQNQGTLPMHCTSSTHSLPLNSSNSNNHRRSLVTRQSVCHFLKTLFNPPSIAILVSFPIALVPKLKALFTPVPGAFIPPAPDGQPPLAFVLDATTFMGAASVPVGLICLGSALARLNLPKKGEWRTLPLSAIGSLAAVKMVIMPVLGVLICQGLTNVGLISRDDKVLRFVCM